MFESLTIFSYFMIFALLIALAYRDMKDYILPDYLNAALALSFCSFHILTKWIYVSPLEALSGAMAGGGLLLLVRFLAEKFYKPDSLGLGDVKLIAAAGLGLGFPGIMMALSLGAFAGVIHGIGMSCAHKTKLDETNVPAGVGLALGIGIMVVYQFRFAWIQ